MTEHQERIGQIVGDYRLVRWLGGGGFGNVYLAEHTRDGSQVAIKVLQIRLANQDDFRAFINEARMIGLRHPHIVPMLDFGLSREDTPFLVMEYAPKGTLRQRHPKGSRVSLPTTVEYVIQIASALQYAHDRHLVHRDVKPENMLCRTDGTILLSDFGMVSVAHASSSVSAYQAFGGTLPYMAPEQHAGHPRPASDQYTLAVVVYEWLAGTRPFVGTVPELLAQHLQTPPPSLLEQVPTLPTKVEQVVFKALSKHPLERFARVDDFAGALQTASQPPVAPPSPASFSPPPTASSGWKPPVPDQTTEAGQTRGSLSSVPAFPPPPESRTRADQLVPGEIPLTFPSSARMTPSEGDPAIHTPRLPAPVPRPTQHRSILNRRVFFTFGLVLLVVLSGGGLLYFGSFVQRTLTLSLSQAATATAAAQAYTTSQAATATAAAQAYATGTTRQGIMFGFDAAHTNHNPYEQTLGPGNVSRLTSLWSFTTGNSIVSSPAVAGGMVYIGSEDGKLYAFDATCRQKCQPLWNFATGYAIDSSPAIAGGMVYVGSLDNGKLYAFDATCRQKCQPLWSFTTGAAIFSSPAVAGGMVYVGSWDHQLYAFDATCRQKCQPLWSFATGSPINSSPAVAGGMVYISSDDGKLYTFDATCRQKCQPLWSFTTGAAIFSSPAVAGGMVYVGSLDHQLYAFDATCRQKCQPLWSFVTGDVIESSPAVAGGMVYVSSDDGKLYTFDATCRQKCQLLWSFTTGGGITGGGIFPSPAVAGGMVYVGSQDHKLYAFDATCRQKCQPLWSFVTGDVIESSPAVAGGMVYVGSQDHKLYAFGLAS